MAEIGIFSLAFEHTKLAAVPAIAAICPLLITAWSALVVGEAVTKAQWVAVGVGFVGMMIILHPGFPVFDPWSILPLTGAALFAVYQILTKVLDRTESGDTILLYTGSVRLAASTVIASLRWVEVDPAGSSMLLLSGLFSVFAQILLIKALATADASVLQPCNCTLLMFTTVLGVLVFGEFPSSLTLLGSAFIVEAGLYGWWCESGQSVGRKSDV